MSDAALLASAGTRLLAVDCEWSKPQQLSACQLAGRQGAGPTLQAGIDISSGMYTLLAASDAHVNAATPPTQSAVTLFQNSASMTSRTSRLWTAQECTSMPNCIEAAGLIVI